MNPYKVDPKKFKCDDVPYEYLEKEYYGIDNARSNAKYVNDTENYLMSKLSRKDGFVLGCGPSIDRNLNYFVDNYNCHHGVVLACDSIMQRLYELRFKPTFFVTSEHDSEPCVGATHTSEVLISDEARKFFVDVPLIASIMANKKYVDRYPGPKHMVVDACAIWNSWLKYSDRFIDDAVPRVWNPGNNVGFLCIGIARRFNATRAILLGMDMMTYEDGHHMKGHFDEHSPMKIQEDGFKRAMEFFVSVNDGEFGIKTLNCTTRGALSPDVCSCELRNIEEFVP